MKLKSRRAVLMAAPLGLAACGMGGQPAESKPVQNVGPAALEIAGHPEEEVYICRRVAAPDWAGAVYPARGATI